MVPFPVSLICYRPRLLYHLAVYSAAFSSNYSCPHTTPPTALPLKALCLAIALHHTPPTSPLALPSMSLEQTRSYNGTSFRSLQSTRNGLDRPKQLDDDIPSFALEPPTPLGLDTSLQSKQSSLHAANTGEPFDSWLPTLCMRGRAPTFVFLCFFQAAAPFTHLLLHTLGCPTMSLPGRKASVTYHPASPGRQACQAGACRAQARRARMSL